MFAPYAFFFYTGSRSIVFRNQRYFIFDGFTGFFQLRHQAFRIICCKAKLLCCKGDAGSLDLAHCLDLSFHLGSAVGAVEPFYDIDALFIFGDVVKVVIVAVVMLMLVLFMLVVVIMTAAAPAVVIVAVMMLMLVLFMLVVVVATAPTVVIVVVMMIVLMLMVMTAATVIFVLMMVMMLMFVFM